MSVVMEMSRLADLIQAMRLQILLAGVLAIHGVQVPVMIRSAREDARDRKASRMASMASTISRVKSRGCEVVKRTRRMPVTSPTACKQFGKALLAQRVAIGIHVLAKQLDIGIAKVRHLAGFRQDRIRGAAALLAARVWDHAVGAKLVATFDDGDVSAMRIAAGGEFSLKGLVGLAIVQAGDAAFPA